MTREEAIEIIRHLDDSVWRANNNISMGKVCDALYLAEEALNREIAINNKEIVKQIHPTFEEWIDEACDWLCGHLNDSDNPDFASKRNHPTDIRSMYHWTVGEMVADFRNYMTKQNKD